MPSFRRRLRRMLNLLNQKRGAARTGLALAAGLFLAWGGGVDTASASTPQLASDFDGQLAEPAFKRAPVLDSFAFAWSDVEPPSTQFLAIPDAPGDADGNSLREAPVASEARRPASDAELRDWLENMAVFHQFNLDEIHAATGLAHDEITAALARFNLSERRVPARDAGARLRVLPYPGGRHPRIGFLEGAIRPQRDTKISVFTPWNPAGYVVVDVPEAIFSNLGLTYLAHTHIPTIWDSQDVRLPKLEWTRRTDGTLAFERVLPNGIAFGTVVTPTSTEVRMELWLRNGTNAKLTGLRVQNCIMLARAPGFSAQTVTNKVFEPPFSAVRSEDGRRWIVTAWEPVQRCWGNEQCPCLHSDPQLPDCEPGTTVRARGWLSFYDGADVRQEFERIKAADLW